MSVTPITAMSNDSIQNINIDGYCRSELGINFKIEDRDPNKFYGVYAEGISNPDQGEPLIRVYAQYNTINIQATTSSSFTVQSLHPGALIKFSFQVPIDKNSRYDSVSCQIKILKNPYSN